MNAKWEVKKLKTYKNSLATEPKDITKEDLESINCYSRRELCADELYIFSLILCDNEIDRDYERFSGDSLLKLAEMFKGKTGVFDHQATSKNQAARIYKTEVLENGEENSIGEAYMQLKAWAYMVKSGKNSDLILEIDAGIKKEVSVGCSVGRHVCSICGGSGCGHKKGGCYDEKLCYFTLEDPTDAYEWSFVAVPAQKNAGVTKGYKDSPAFLKEASLEKLFAASTDVILKRDMLMRMRGDYEQLCGLAGLGLKFKEKQKAELIKYMLLAGEADSKTIYSLADKLDISETEAFIRVYKEKAAKQYPVKSQLEAGCENENNASEFKLV